MATWTQEAPPWDVALNESPSEKEGKFRAGHCWVTGEALNESPSEKEGKSAIVQKILSALPGPSMKVPPKRKGNTRAL